MQQTEYDVLYSKIFKILDKSTPLKADCGQLCERACCKGDNKTGMRLFPFEQSELEIVHTDDGYRLAVCNGTCDRDKRPLACRIFPFFPTVDENGKVFVELDYRGYNLCPMVKHYDQILFDKRFLRKVKKIGQLLAKDKNCLNFLIESTEEIDMYAAFLDK